MTLTLMSACGATPAPTLPLAVTPAATAIVPTTAPPTRAPIATATDPTRPQDLRLKTEDGATLVARQWGGGPDWVILSSNGDGKSARWLPLAEALAKRGWAVLTYDWRGTNPDAPGKNEWTLAVTDARAALAHARAQGARRIVLAGGSLGGIASIKLGAEQDVAGVIAVGTPYTVAPLTVSIDDLKSIRVPKLFVASAGDATVPSSETQWLHDNAPAPKALHTYAGAAHGVELLSGSDKQDFIDRVSAFVAAAFASLSGGVEDAAAMRARRWREDLRALVDALKAIHPKLFYKGNEAEVNGLVAGLDARLETLSDDQIKAGLLRIAARESDWMTCLEDCRTLYIQYNAVQPASGSESLSAFAGRARELVRSKSIPRVVVDLRHNGEGDNNTYGPLLTFLQSEEVNQAGRLYVITGRNTFSAAANFAVELERSTRATIVGEPTGGSPNLYADTRTASLPNSKIEVWVSARYVQKSAADDPRLTIDPGRPALLSSADWLAGRDPALAAALR